MSNETEQLRALITGMRAAYARGENVMAYARAHASGPAAGDNSLVATLIAYDLQAGAYTAAATADPVTQQTWSSQIADLIRPYLPASGKLLEVGVGEATTLAGILGQLGGHVGGALGFDISWSRVREGQRWLARQGQQAELFIGDLFHIPLADSSVDVVYSSHSLEPNGGREEAAIAECLRVARHAVVLVEPIYELVSPEAQARMRAHGYVRGLRAAAARLGATIADYRLLERCHNPLNPSGVISLRKTAGNESAATLWRCPLTGAVLERKSDCYIARDLGVVYPILRGVPLLRPEHAVIASMLTAE